jgi:hypothetical protein
MIGVRTTLPPEDVPAAGIVATPATTPADVRTLTSVIGDEGEAATSTADGAALAEMLSVAADTVVEPVTALGRAPELAVLAGA